MGRAGRSQPFVSELHLVLDFIAVKGPHKGNEDVTDVHYIHRKIRYCVIPFLKYIPTYLSLGILNCRLLWSIYLCLSEYLQWLEEMVLQHDDDLGILAI